MTVCCNPGCVHNDDQRDDVMHLEYIERDDVWVPVCEKHVMDNRPTIEKTGCVGSIPADILTHIKEELSDN